jgi:ketosteroid isomerase-like protein
VGAEAIRAFVERWFEALGERRTDVLIEMCNPDVVIRPFLARQPVDAVTYAGHDGVRHWLDSLDSKTRIELALIGIDVTGPQSAIVEAEVWMEIEGARTGSLTFSVWRFDGAKLSEAIGYGSKEDAQDAEAGAWH